jgi:hypothetical protein
MIQITPKTQKPPQSYPENNPKIPHPPLLSYQMATMIFHSPVRITITHNLRDNAQKPVKISSEETVAMACPEKQMDCVASFIQKHATNFSSMAHAPCMDATKGSTVSTTIPKCAKTPS